MTIADLLLPEFDQEMATTRRVLERVPEDKFAWKPHAKSMSAGQLGWQPADAGSAPWRAPTYSTPCPAY